MTREAQPVGREHQIVVQMHGEPGSGKSTLARTLASCLGAIVLDKDVIKAALLRSGIAESAAAPGAYEVYFAQARSLAGLGHSLVLDNPIYWPTVEERWLEVAKIGASPQILIECVCSDRAALAQRLATRDAVESQPRVPLDLRRHPGSCATRYEPRLTLETTRPLPELVEDTLAYIEQIVRDTAAAR